MSKKGRQRVLFMLAILGALMFTIECASTQKRAPVGPMDRPKTHFNTGWGALDEGNVELAKLEFKKALELDPKYAPAIGGMAIISALEGKKDEALAKLNEGDKYAESDEDRYWFELGALRTKLVLKQKDWLDECYKHFKKASKLKPADGAAYYFMGVAYKEAQDYDKATLFFATVITLDKGYVSMADKQWADVQKIVRAQPGTRVGKELAPKEKLTRAEVAALLIEEFRINRFFKKGELREEKMPEGVETATDYKGHPYEGYIKEILKYKLRGLSFEYGSGTFGPNRAVSRAEFALIIEDILVKVNQEYGLPTTFIASEPSPFKDVEPSYGAYNAIVVATTRGFMDADLDGNFYPNKPITGAEALLSLRLLESKLEKGVFVNR